MKLRSIDDVLKEFPDFKSEWKIQENGDLLSKLAGRLMHRVICDDNGKPLYDKYVIQERPGVIIIPYDIKDGVVRVGLIQEERPVAGEIYFQAPMGGIEEGENFVDAARRELFEETGLQAVDYRVIGESNHNPVFFTDKDPIVVACCDEIKERSDIEKVGTENIIGIKPYTFKELIQLQHDNKLICGITKGALLEFGCYMPEFFKE